MQFSGCQSAVIKPCPQLFHQDDQAVARSIRRRSASAISIIATPPNMRLTPTMAPIAHVTVAGRPIRIIEAKDKSTIPLASIQPHRPDNSRRCSSANMIVAKPSNTKKAVRSNGSMASPNSGRANKITATAIVEMAESNDHRNPGACHIRTVVISPANPPSRSSQPTSAIATPGGINTARIPSPMSSIPSLRCSPQ
jgi:hypothetical protein